MTRDEFMKECTACGGNWTRMILTGIESFDPKLFERLPDITYEFDEVVFIMNHLCSDTPKFRYNRSLGGRVLEWTVDGNVVVHEEHYYMRNFTGKDFDRIYNGYNEECGGRLPEPTYFIVGLEFNGKVDKFVSAHPTLNCALESIRECKNESKRKRSVIADRLCVFQVVGETTTLLHSEQDVSTMLGSALSEDTSNLSTMKLL